MATLAADPFARIRPAPPPNPNPSPNFRVAERVMTLMKQEQTLIKRHDEAVRTGTLEGRAKLNKQLDTVREQLSTRREELFTRLGGALEREYRPLNTELTKVEASRTKVLLQIIARRIQNQPTARLDDSAARLTEQVEALRGKLDTLTRRAMRRTLA